MGFITGFGGYFDTIEELKNQAGSAVVLSDTTWNVDTAQNQNLSLTAQFGGITATNNTTISNKYVRVNLG